MSKLLRIKCPTCGTVADIQESGTPCKKCGNPLILPEDGVIQLYRMGSMFGMAVGFGVYINGIPMGHLANTESIRIPVTYGHYNISFSHGGIKKCIPAEFDVTPQDRFIYLKAHIKPGLLTNTIVTERVPAETMPPL